MQQVLERYHELQQYMNRQSQEKKLKPPTGIQPNIWYSQEPPHAIEKMQLGGAYFIVVDIPMGEEFQINVKRIRGQLGEVEPGMFVTLYNGAGDVTFGDVETNPNPVFPGGVPHMRLVCPFIVDTYPENGRALCSYDLNISGQSIGEGEFSIPVLNI